MVQATDQATDQVIPIIAQEIDDLVDGLASVKIQVVAAVVVLEAGAVEAAAMEVVAAVAAMAAMAAMAMAMVGVLLRRPPASATRPAPTPPPKIACWTVSATR